MTPTHALQILESLAINADTLATGERSSEQIETALTLAMTALENQINADARKSERPDNAGKPWEQEEIVALTQAFDEGDTIASLAVMHGRTKGAIKSRLEKLGLMAD